MIWNGYKSKKDKIKKRPLSRRWYKYKKKSIDWFQEDSALQVQR